MTKVHASAEVYDKSSETSNCPSEEMWFRASVFVHEFGLGKVAEYIEPFTTVLPNETRLRAPALKTTAGKPA